MACGEPESCLCLIGQASISHACLATKVWASLLLALFHMHAHTASALRRYQSRSSRFHLSTDCRPSPPGIHASICTTSGYFTYTADCSFYLSCPAPGLHPLLCPCPYSDMFFNTVTGRCQLAILMPPKSACHHLLPTSPPPPPRRRYPSRASNHQLLKSLLEHGPHGKRTMPYYRPPSLRSGKPPLGTGPQIVTHHGRMNMTFTNEGELLLSSRMGGNDGVMDDNGSSSEQEVKWDSKGQTIEIPTNDRKPPGYTIVGDGEAASSTKPDHSVSFVGDKDSGAEIKFGSRPDLSDPSMVPAWAIAAVVLCVVIILVSLILFFY